MGSVNAALVANDVLGNIRKGKKVSIKSLAIKHGYAETTADTAEVQNTKTYKAIIDPALEKYIKQRDKVLDEMGNKDLTNERYDTLSQSLARLTHDIQLLSGKSTENVSVEEDRKVLLAVIEQLRLPPKSE